MKNISCNIIEDLLPLYVDDVCGDETREIIEEHIKDCRGCRQKLEQMKSNLPLDNMDDNFDDSKIIRKLSDIWVKNTRIDKKAGIIVVVFYVFAIVALFIMEWMNQQAHQTFDFRYSIAHLMFRVFIGISVGGLIAFLGSRPKSSKRGFIFELLIIGIPSILMLSSPFLGYLVFYVNTKISTFIMVNATNITYLGALLVGCEIYRIIGWVRKGNSIRMK